MNGIKISQRLASVSIVLLLLLGGAALGTVGQYPATPDGTYLTPELIGEKLAPIGWIIASLWALFGAIKARVDNGVLDPGDLVALIKTEEFWIAFASWVAAVFEMFGGKVIDEGTQTLIINVGLGMAALLLRDYGTRTAKIQSYSVRGPLPPQPAGMAQHEVWKS